MASPDRILIVDDEKTIRTVLSEALLAHGYQVAEAADAPEALRALARETFDLALLDLKLPGSMDGLGLLQHIHTHAPQTVVIMLTAYATLDSAVAALRQGAYDYLTKPASIPQIIESVERGIAKKREDHRRLQLIDHLEQTLEELKQEGRATPTGAIVEARFVKTPSLMLDRQKRLAVRGDQPLLLTATEFDLLDYLAQHADRVVTAREIVKEIQGYDLAEVDARPLVRVHIQRLRQKLEDDPDNPRYILNVRGRGYRFVG
jgi:DNA-binding response OmpR family regulator